MKESGSNSYIYYACMVTKAKHENLYVREFVEYYLNLGVEKFYFGDDNEENIENLSDVLDDYIKKGIVDVEYIYNRIFTHYEYFEYAFRAIKFRCKWFLFYDVDEYLEFTDKNMTLKSYLDMPVFDKCDAIRIHWVIYDDNNLVHYDKRPLRERFNHSLPNNNNKFNLINKSIVRGKDLGLDVFTKSSGNHQPDSRITAQCDALGNFETVAKGILTSPKYKYCHINHYYYKSTEEFGVKLLKGMHEYPFDHFLRTYMSYYTRDIILTEEKLNLIEHIVNTTFPQYHKNKKYNETYH